MSIGVFMTAYNGPLDANAEPTEAAEPFAQSAASGSVCGHCGQVHPGGRFIQGCAGPALKTGEHSRLVRSGAVTGGELAMADARSALRNELGEAGIIKNSLADAFVELGAVRDYLGGRLGNEGPLTAKGRTRALLSAYLNVVDRQVRLAQLLGLDRRAKNVTETFDSALAREPEAR
jgi:hypothetical protein